MHKEIIVEAGNPDGTKALILLHGRGAGAADILELAQYLNVKDFVLLAPQATNNTWYPQSFLAAPKENEPWLTAALDLVGKTMENALAKGVAKENIYFLGFSQGACLASEFMARNAALYGGAAIFTGGVIGDTIYPENYKGDFKGTPVFIGTSNPDFHVPVERVHATTRIFKDLGADVTESVYDHIGHTIIQEEIELANRIVFRQV